MESIAMSSSSSSNASSSHHHHHHQQQQQHQQQWSSSSYLRICCSATSGNHAAHDGGGKLSGSGSSKINGSSNGMTSGLVSLATHPLSLSSILTQKVLSTSYMLSEAVLSALAGVTQIPIIEKSEDSLRQGRLVETVVYRQTFVVRSYEVGADKTATIETFLNLFQETALNHVLLSGLAGDGFGATHEMIRNNLIWVVSRMQVEVETYPAWGDGLEIDTWVAASGKNGMRRDWLVRNYKNGAILARATSTWVMMHKSTRRLSKMPDKVRAEIGPWFLTRTAFVNDQMRKITKLDHKSQVIRSGLTPRHSDLDMNQHVNNVKYLSWMMESLPPHMFESHELVGITLEYRKECSKSDTVQSLADPETSSSTDSSSLLEFTHLLRMENDGSEIVRARSAWKVRQCQQQ